MSASSLRVALATLAAFACASEPAPPTPALSIAGVVTFEEQPVPGATVWLRLWDSRVLRDPTPGQVPLVEDTAVTDADGRFNSRLELDTLLTDGLLDGFVTPPFGSGLTDIHFDVFPTFDETGRRDTTVVFTVDRAEPPVPSGPTVPLDPARLVGSYVGETVPPYTLDGAAYLTLQIDSADAAGPFGGFHIDFSATTACGEGQGPIEGSFGGDTLHLRIVAGPPPYLQDFLVTSYDPANDTLIVHYPAGDSGACPWGSPAPLRLVRQAAP